MSNLVLKDTILRIMREHTEKKNGLIMGECVRGNFETNYAIPYNDNVIDIPMSETAGADFAIGCALAGRRPVFLVKYQDFMLLGASPFITFSSVVKELQGVAAPVFIRAIGQDHFDSNHSNVLHSFIMHYPGIFVCAPMTSLEYENAWDTFIKNDKPFYCSEYKDSYTNSIELKDDISEDAVINVFCISKPRLYISEVKKILLKKGIKINIFHIAWLKPFDSNKYNTFLKQCPLGLVIDADRVICGASEHIAYTFMHNVRGSKVYALGIEDVPKSTNPKFYNEVPTADTIAKYIIQILN